MTIPASQEAPIIVMLLVKARAGKPYTGTTSAQVTVAVQGAAATIGVSPASLTFTASAGGSSPANQSLTISNTGAAGSTLTWSAALQSRTAWLTLPGTRSGTNAGTVPVGVNIASLAAGDYMGTIRIAAAGASNTPVDVTVNLTVSVAGALDAFTKTQWVLWYSLSSGWNCIRGGQSVSPLVYGPASALLNATPAVWSGTGFKVQGTDVNGGKLDYEGLISGDLEKFRSPDLTQ